MNHEPVVFRTEGGTAAPGVFGGHVEGFAQASVTGFGQPIVASGESGEVQAGYQLREGADTGQEIKPMRDAESAQDLGGEHGSHAAC